MVNVIVVAVVVLAVAVVVVTIINVVFIVVVVRSTFQSYLLSLLGQLFLTTIARARVATTSAMRNTASMLIGLPHHIRDDSCAHCSQRKATLW